MADLYKQFNKYVRALFGLFNKGIMFCRLSLKECKGPPGPGLVPTVPVSHDANQFISLIGVIFVKSIKGT